MTHPAVTQLSVVLAPPAEPVGRPLDWDRVAETWNTFFPADYRDFMNIYGAGSIDDYLVIATALDPRLEMRESTVGALTEVARALHQEHADWPYRVWPEAGGLICWGATIDSAVLYWDTTESDPCQWPVVVRDEAGRFRGVANVW